jgi:hypothetical protein
LDTSIRERFMKLGIQSGVDRQAVKRYIDRVVKFCEKLAVLINISSRRPT